MGAVPSTSSESTGKGPIQNLLVLPKGLRRLPNPTGTDVVLWQQLMHGDPDRLLEYRGVICGPVRYLSRPGQTRHARVCAALREGLLRGCRIVFMLPESDRDCRSEAVFREVTGWDLSRWSKKDAPRLLITPACPLAVSTWVDRHPPFAAVRPVDRESWGAESRPREPWVVTEAAAPRPVVVPVEDGAGEWLALYVRSDQLGEQDPWAALEILEELGRGTAARPRAVVSAAMEDRPAATRGSPPSPASPKFTLEVARDGRGFALNGTPLVVSKGEKQVRRIIPGSETSAILFNLLRRRSQKWSPLVSRVKAAIENATAGGLCVVKGVGQALGLTAGVDVSRQAAAAERDARKSAPVRRRSVHK